MNHCSESPDYQPAGVSGNTNVQDEIILSRLIKGQRERSLISSIKKFMKEVFDSLLNLNVHKSHIISL